MKARLAIIATMCVVVVLNACGDPTSLKANSITSVDTLYVFALSGTPPTYPSGVSILAKSAIRVDGFAGFDVAFDIDESGRTVVYPVKMVVTSPGGSRPVGLQKVAGSFETVLAAPASGYETDSSFVLGAGETLVIQAPHNSGSQDICSFALSPYLYGKIGVDSVNLASRTIYIQLGLDPNCGFRSFASGIPTS
jgi:hypothetical protein